MDFHVAIKICTNDITVNRLCECSCLSQNIGPWYNTVECTGIKFVPLMMVSCSSITHYYDARAKRGMFILLWLTYYQLGQCSLCTSSRARLKHTVNWMENINSHHSKLIFLYVIFEQIISTGWGVEGQQFLVFTAKKYLYFNVSPQIRQQASNYTLFQKVQGNS